MARSSTTYTAKWRCGRTGVIRVPEFLAEELIEIARGLDESRGPGVPRGDRGGTVTGRRVAATSLDPSMPINVATVPQRSPFRYPGGKTWLVPFLREWIRSLPLKPSIFIEPFAGGGIASLTVAFEQLAGHVVMAETDENVCAVWRTVLGGQAQWLAEQILRFDLTTSNVRRALAEDSNGSRLTLRHRAFLTILRNRVQRGGIMAPGAGLIKNGENNRGISSRWYPETLARRIREIALNLDRLSFLPCDGFKLIEDYLVEPGAIFYIDPPYTASAKRLYRNWMVDHRHLFDLMSQCKGAFLMSYDDTPEIRRMASEFEFRFRSISMKNTHHARQTELLISRDLGWLEVASGS